ncbi:MAG: hypothetical protein NXI32_15225 [bacterium]|nr:hypothetical protein [bacterium]
MLPFATTIFATYSVLFLFGASFANGKFKLRLDPGDPEDAKRIGIRIIATIFVLIWLVPSLATATNFANAVTRLSVFVIPAVGFFTSNWFQQGEQPLITRRMVGDFFLTTLISYFFVFAVDPRILFSGLPVFSGRTGVASSTNEFYDLIAITNLCIWLVSVCLVFGDNYFFSLATTRSSYRVLHLH